MNINIKVGNNHLLILGILILAIFAMRMSLGATGSTPKNPGHPLSETWIDTDLNMGGHAITNIDSLTVSGTRGYLRLPPVTTAERDLLSVAEGTLVYNTDKKMIEAYNGVIWTAPDKHPLTFAGSAHTEEDCANGGGTLAFDGSGKSYCQFTQPTCPIGWSQAAQWASQTGVCASGGDICGNHKTTCPTGWSNPPGACTGRSPSGGESLMACGCTCRVSQWHKPGFPSGNYYIADSIALSTLPYGSCGIDAIGCK